MKFIKGEYSDRNENPLKILYIHVTDATNTENVRFIWKATKAIIAEQSLNQTGLIV